MLGGITPGHTLFQCGVNFTDRLASSSVENPELTLLMAMHLNDSPSRKRVVN